MKRILVVATSEFLQLVRSKFFIIGILMLPVLILVSVGIQIFAERSVDRESHAFAVIDRTGVLYAPLATAAEAHNKAAGSGETQKGPHFVPAEIVPAARPIDEIKLELSDRVKRKELFAFIEIPAEVLDITRTESNPITYFTQTPSYDDLPDWIETTLAKEIDKRRFVKASIDPAMISKLTRSTVVSMMGLVERKADGTAGEAKKTSPIATRLVPFALMYLLFMAVMTGAPQLLNAVIEEKMSKISEVLIASVTPFQLLMGKMLGTVAVSVILAVLYLGGGSYAAFATGQWELIQPALFGWFLLYLLCAVMIFGAIFIAIGAASSDIKDAQGMMQVAMLIMLLPMFLAPVVLRSPHSGLSVGASLFPPATPFLMLIRLAMTPAPPAWQVALSVVLTIATACALVYCAGKIFRVGLLMQGKGATMAEMIKWIRA